MSGYQMTDAERPWANQKNAETREEQEKCA